MAKEKCCCSFITKMSIDEASWQRRMFMQIYGKDEYWHDFSANKVLTWLHGKDECWRGLTVNEVLTWLHVEKASLKKTSANLLQ